MKRKITTILVLALAFTTLQLSAKSQLKNPFKQMKKVLRAIHEPKFPNREYQMLDYYNGTDSLYTAAINEAINTCSKQGGGHVIIPDGTWKTGPIRLKSNVDLHLSDKAHLLFSTDPRIFPTVLTREEGIDCYNISPLIYAYGEKNIAITGKGIMDGQSDETNWQKKERRNIQKDSKGKIGERNLLLEYKVNRTPIEQRRFEGMMGMRPQFVNTYKCENVLIEGLTFNRSPFWILHPLLSKNVIVRDVNLDSHGRNNDGCDPESCENVLIERCRFNTGDDCIAIKSGKDEDGRVWNIPSKNIIIRNCEMKDGHAGVGIGSEITGGCENVWVENCKMDSPNLTRVIRIKSNPERGGEVKNLYVRNVEVGVCDLAVLGIEQKYWYTPTGPYMPYFHDFYFENVKSSGSKYALHIDGHEGTAQVENIYMKNCRFDNVSKPERNMIIGTRNILLDNVYINGEKQPSER